jgi:hypothetical protein
MTRRPRDEDDPRLAAAVDLLRRTGAASFAVRYSDDETPIVWLAVAEYRDGRWEAAAGHHPLQATLRLCDTVVDGGKCTHCGRMTGFEAKALDAMPANELVCWYQYDPGRQAYVRGCAA